MGPEPECPLCEPGALQEMQIHMLNIAKYRDDTHTHKNTVDIIVRLNRTAVTETSSQYSSGPLKQQRRIVRLTRYSAHPPSLACVQEERSLMFIMTCL